MEIPTVTREEIVSRLEAEPRCELLVVGGGIHGAALAHFAARAGVRTVLLEAHDYAAATSSRSSKTAHGGLRYLEMLDFRQVWEGIQAREELFRYAPHLVSPQRFLIPIGRGEYWQRIKLKVGLALYSTFSREARRPYRWVPRADFDGVALNPQRADLAGCFEYWDGIMNDTRLVLEHVLAARAHGASALNYARVQSLEPHANGVRAAWRDERSGRSFELEARAVVNCAGPWALDLHPDRRLGIGVRFSRGIHLLFRAPWQDPVLFVPLAEAGRYYFVWPHQFGTMVGTTEREVERPELDPQPWPDEVEEILSRLKRDVPAVNLSRDTLYYAFAGVRTLPFRSERKGVAKLSRRHEWVAAGNVLTLLGGKYTTATWSSWEGFTRACALLGRAVPPYAPPIYPSCVSEEERNQFVEELHARYGLASQVAARLVRRHGLRALDLPRELYRELESGVSFAEVDLALRYEQVETLEDLVRRRLELEYAPGHGLMSFDALEPMIRAVRPNLDFDAETRAYAHRLELLAESLRISPELPHSFCEAGATT